MAQEKAGEIKKIVAAVNAAVQAPTLDTSPIVRDTDAAPLVSTPDLNPRNRAAAEIAARSNKDRDAEAKETIPPGEEDAARAAAEAEPDVPNVAGDSEPQTLPDAPLRDEGGRFAAAEPATPAPTAPVGFDTDAEYELIVQGRAITVKGSQIVDMGKLHIQKESAADYKLEQASRILRDAEARAAKPAEPAPPAKTTLDYAQAVQFGTTEQAASVLEEFKKEVLAEARREAVKVVPGMTQDQMAFQKAADFVQSEYGDLMADPYLKPLFEAEELKRRKAGFQGSYTDLYKGIGEDLRKHFNRPKVGAPAAPAPSLAQRQEAKASAPAAPKLASVRLSGGGDAKKPATREDIIAGMQASRGMNALTKH